VHSHLFLPPASQDIARTRAPPRSADANRLTKRTPRLLCYPQVTVTIVVQEQGADEIRRIATAVSDPRSPEYGNFLSSAEIIAKSAPSVEDMAAVTNWLDAAGVGYQTRHSNIIATMPVSAASTLFSTTFHAVEHLAHPRTLIRAAADYALPAEVAASVQTVFGLHGLPLPPRTAELQIASHGPFPRQPANVTPAVIAETYGIKGVKVSRSDKNRQAVAEFQGQFMNSTDLATMFADYVSDYTVGTDDVVSTFFGKHEENSQVRERKHAFNRLCFRCRVLMEMEDDHLPRQARDTQYKEFFVTKIRCLAGRRGRAGHPGEARHRSLSQCTPVPQPVATRAAEIEPRARSHTVRFPDADADAVFLIPVHYGPGPRHQDGILGVSRE
jgi:hypothetical protein